MAENLPEDYASALVARGICPLQGMAEAIDAAEAAASIGEAWRGPAPPPLAHGNIATPARPAILDEAAAKACLRDAGLGVPRGCCAKGPDEAVAAADAIGYPVALKALGVAHKSDRHALRLGLPDAASVRQVAGELLAIGSGLYVEAMVPGPVAELIVGIVREPPFGPVMTVGSGGVLVELLGDSTVLLLPATPAEIAATLSRLKLFPLLDGYRGRPKADLAAVTAAIVAVQDFALGNAQALVELDINPLIVCRQGAGAWVADALLVMDRRENV
jgi:acyl-CoA synthetase (NDP forming)